MSQYLLNLSHCNDIDFRCQLKQVRQLCSWKMLHLGYLPMILRELLIAIGMIIRPRLQSDWKLRFRLLFFQQLPVELLFQVLFLQLNIWRLQFHCRRLLHRRYHHSLLWHLRPTHQFQLFPLLRNILHHRLLHKSQPNRILKMQHQFHQFYWNQRLRLHHLLLQNQKLQSHHHSLVLLFLLHPNQH